MLSEIILTHIMKTKTVMNLIVFVVTTNAIVCKNSGLVRTEDYNSVFLWVALKQVDLWQKKCGISSLNLDYAALVAGE